jgi:hypothetical protein
MIHIYIKMRLFMPVDVQEGRGGDDQEVGAEAGAGAEV